MKAHILIVEDEVILYDRLAQKLKKEHYTVSQFTPSVTEAIAQIKLKRPDIVLLDINLEGRQTGLDLGNILHSDYQIPFIYVTSFDDDETFFKGLQTNHASFYVKSKPKLDFTTLHRHIQTVLKQKEINKKEPSKEGVLGLIHYLEDIKEFNKGSITRAPVKYEDIVFFTVKPFLNEDNKEEVLRANYLWLQTQSKEYFFLKTSLRVLQKSLPYNFVRINESYIVNIAPNMFDGQINGSKLSIKNTEFIVNSTYKGEVKKRIAHFYQ